MIYKDAESKINSRKNDFEEKNLINGEGKSVPNNYGWNFDNKNQPFPISFTALFYLVMK